MLNQELSKTQVSKTSLNFLESGVLLFLIAGKYSETRELLLNVTVVCNAAGGEAQKRGWAFSAGRRFGCDDDSATQDCR